MSDEIELHFFMCVETTATQPIKYVCNFLMNPKHVTCLSMLYEFIVKILDHLL